MNLYSPLSLVLTLDSKPVTPLRLISISPDSDLICSGHTKPKSKYGRPLLTLAYLKFGLSSICLALKDNLSSRVTGWFGIPFSLALILPSPVKIPLFRVFCLSSQTVPVSSLETFSGLPWGILMLIPGASSVSSSSTNLPSLPLFVVKLDGAESLSILPEYVPV